MSRTLGNVSLNENQSDQESNNQPFYLHDQLPMFLAHNQDNVKNTKNIDEDMAKCKLLIEQLCDNQIKTKQTLQGISQSIEQQEHLNKGMGYYAAKNLVFMEYLILLKLYELFKINGKTLTSGNGLELYKRLAYLKTLLLKLQPVEKKLEYQKNKILKHADRAVVTKEKKQLSDQDQQGESDGNQVEEENNNQQESIEEQKQEDEMAFKPRPASLMKVKQQRDIRLNRNDKYQAPKISSNLSKQDKMKQRMERQKQIRKLGLIRRLQSDLIQDDRAEQRFLGDQINQRFKRKFQQKINYEEDAFIRVPDSKKDKFYMKQAIRNSTRRNQLDQDFKEVQMVRQLFEEQNKMESKMLHQKRKHQKFNKKSNQNQQKNQERNQNPKKGKKIFKK